MSMRLAMAVVIVALPRLAAAAVCAPGFQDAGNNLCTATLVYTGAPQTVTVPANVSIITAVVSGAEGGTSLEEQVDPFGGAASPGGKGGRETATIPVAAGATLTVVVGQAGTGGVLAPPGYGGYGGGGHASSRYGGNGGGGSFVFDDAGPLIAAGGGGGGGYDYNPMVMGRGDQHNPGGDGAGASAAGDGQSVSFCCDGTAPAKAEGGHGATPTAGGLGGHPSLGSGYVFGQMDGDPGSGPAIDALNLGNGGNTHQGCCSYTGWAGGGGGGYYGGGGGGNIEAQLEGGGGGGGAGFVVPSATNAFSAVGIQIGDGEVVISYVAGGIAPTPTPIAPTATPVASTPTATPGAGATPTSGGPIATVTATATATSTPTPTVTPTPALDHFTCYASGTSKGATKLALRTGDTFADAFGTSPADVEAPDYLCAPTNKLGENPAGPSHPEYLIAHHVKPSVKLATRTNVRVTDQLTGAGLLLDVKKPSIVMLPSLVAPGGPTPPLATFVTDDFQCHAVVPSKGAAKFVPIPNVTLTDAFGPMTVDVRKPKLLCAPADVNGTGPSAPQHPAYLACYDVKQVDAVKFAPRANLYVQHDFGPETLDAKKPALLCVPATVAP